ncbi:hypothetical protein LguiB_005919 [Lonicera macranthoides]
MSRKLQKIRSRLEDIDADRKQFELVEHAPDSSVMCPLREQTHSFVRSSDVIGRDLDKNKIGMKNLTALRHLRVYECPSLTFFPAESMRYLTSLEILWILKCEKLNLLEEEDMTMELPRGLLSLILLKISKLKELPRGFENAVATIKYIRIDDCPFFEILPEWLQNCTSLTKLQLRNCMLLESVPLGMHQLTALQLLRIEICSESLSRKCKWETGEYWPWISQIPEIYLP